VIPDEIHGLRRSSVFAVVFSAYRTVRLFAGVKMDKNIDRLRKMIL